MTVASALIGCMVLSFFSSAWALARASFDSLAVDLFLKLLNLVGFALVAAAQFGLDRLELLVEVIFALGLFHLALHAATDLALHLKHAQFALHEGKHHFQTLERVGFREHGLLVGDLGGKVGGDRIGQLARVVDVAQLLPGILRELLGQLGIFGELIDHRAHHGRDFGPGHRFRLDRFDLRHQHGAIAAGFGLKGLEFGAPVPSTSTRTVPSGSLSSWSTEAITPVS
jgi:hypothetical protein